MKKTKYFWRTVLILLVVNIVIGFIFNLNFGEIMFVIVMIAMAIAILAMNITLFFSELRDVYKTEYTGIADYLLLIYLSLINPIITILYYITML